MQALSAACLMFGDGFVFIVKHRCCGRPWSCSDGPSYRPGTKYQCGNPDSIIVVESREKGALKVSGRGSSRYTASYNEPDPK